MSDEQVPQGSIPPKASPFSKPEGASPITPAAPGAPRPITVRLKPAAPAAATPAASAPKAPEAPPPTPMSAAPRLTARVPIPELPPAGQASVHIPRPPTAHVPEVPGVAASQPPPPTVRLRPVAPSAAGTGPTPAAAPVMTPIAASPMQPVPAPAPGSHPLPDGPKPPSGAQVQAAKSKTSRISLDSAIGVAPMTPMSGDKSEPKTIRLKRPADLAAPTPKVSTAPIRQTSRIPDSVLPTPEAAAAEAASVTQKKTLKIKRPGGAPTVEAGAAAAEGGEAPEGVQMTPISAMDFPPAKEESKVFTGLAVAAASAAAVVLVLMTVCLGSHAVGSVANMNTTASFQISGFQPVWPGAISE